MLKRHALTTCLLLCATVLVQAKPVVLTLKDVVYLALRNNPDVQQADLGRITQKLSVVVAKYQFQPHYSLDGGYSFDRSKSSSGYGTTNSANLDGGVTLENHYGTVFSAKANNNLSSDGYAPQLSFSITQPLIRGFGKPVVMATLENVIDSEKANRLNFKQLAMSTIATVLQNYFNLIEANQSLAIAKESLKQNQQTVANDKRLIAAGKMAGADIVQAQAQVASAQASIEQERNAVDTATNNLLDSLGLSEEVDIQVPSTFNFAKTVALLTSGGKLPDLKASQKIALKNNTPYQVAKITINNLARDVIVAVNNNKPKLDLTASATRGSEAGGGGVNQLQNFDNQFKVDLSVPINNVPDQAAIVNAKVGLDQAKIQLKETKRKLLTQVKTDYKNLLTSYNQLVASRRALALQRRNYNINNQLLLAGKISNFQLLTLQTELITAENTVVTNQINYLIAIANYENELGIALDPWHVKVRY